MASDQERERKARIEEETISRYWNDPTISRTEHRVISGDSRDMTLVMDSSVHLIITSPPYFNAKEYAQWDDLSDYLMDVRRTMAECYRVLKPGRKFCLNISDLPMKGEWGVKWVPLGAELLKLCIDVGFELVDRVIWFKTPLKGFQYGSLPYPPSPLICDSVEYIFILRKPGKAVYAHVPKEAKEASRLRRSEYAEYTKQIWSMRRVTLKENVNGHIAPFPDELPHRCIKLYSFVGETVLDPFGGRGTTSKMAMQNKRNSILYEIRREYIPLIRENLSACQNEDDLSDRVEFIDG